MHAWRDPWLPRPGDFRPISRRGDRLSMVADFITADRVWDLSALQEHFEPVDVGVIVSIPLSSRIVPDKLVWHYDSKGRFSTKSAYQLARQLVHTIPSASGISHSVHFWKQVWFSQIPGKLKVHIWRACSSILPTISKLRSKRVAIVDGCYFCNAEDETIEHVSRDCCFIRDLGKLFPELRVVFQGIDMTVPLIEYMVISVCTNSW